METLKRRRLAKAWSIRDMAERAGVAKETIASAERGEDVRLSSMRKIADVLGVDVLDVPEFVAVIDRMEGRQRSGAGDGEA